MLRFFVATIFVLAISGCADNSFETAKMARESHLSAHSPETTAQFSCDLTVFCLDGVK